VHFFSTRCIRLNESRAIAMMFVYLFFYDGRALWSRCMLARIKVYGWIVQCSGHPDTKARPPTPSRLSSSTWKGGGVWICKLGTISQERLKIEVKLPLSANRKLYMQRWFWHNNGRSWLTFNGPFTVLHYALRIISAVAELLLHTALTILLSLVTHIIFSSVIS